MLPAGLAMSPEGAAALVGIASPTALGRGLPAPAEAPSGSTTGLCVSRGDRGLTCQLLLCGHSLLFSYSPCLPAPFCTLRGSGLLGLYPRPAPRADR